MRSCVKTDWFKNHSKRFSGKLFFTENMSKHTYYRIGGPAALIAVPESENDLEWLGEGIERAGLPVYVLGRGSNLLVHDKGFDGVVIKATKLNSNIVEKNETLETGASVPITTLLRKACSYGWGGLEFLTGIPGTVGGAVFMNAGTHLGEVKESLLEAKVWQLGVGVENYSGEQLKFEYRRNLFLPEKAVIFSATWGIIKKDSTLVNAEIMSVLNRRKSTQPLDSPSCGSVFKNPKKEIGKYAWQVIDEIGLRGHAIGGAMFSKKHCNFIVNFDHAKAADVKALIDLAKERALAQGIELEEEVRYLGF